MRFPTNLLAATGVAFLLSAAPDRSIEANSGDPAVWLVANVPPATTILHDATFRPPDVFAQTRAQIGPSFVLIHALQPELIIVDEASRTRFTDPDSLVRVPIDEAPPRARTMPQQRTRDIHFTHQYLAEGRIPGYALTRDFGGIRMYGLVNTDAPRSERLAIWQSSRGVGSGSSLDGESEAAARHAFGEVHLAAGNVDEAKSQFRLALAAHPANTGAAYGLGLLLAQQDSLGAAERAFDLAASHVPDPSLLRARQGWDFGQMGLYERSREVSRQAHELNPEHPYPLYNIALTYLSEGRIPEADSVYTIARKRYGLPDPTRSLLTGLLQRESLSPEARKVIERVLSAP